MNSNHFSNNSKIQIEITLKAEDFIEKPYIYQIYHMPREKTKVFWILPNEYLNGVIEETLQMPKGKDDKNKKVFIFNFVFYRF